MPHIGVSGQFQLLAGAGEGHRVRECSLRRAGADRGFMPLEASPDLGKQTTITLDYALADLRQAIPELEQELQQRCAETRATSGAKYVGSDHC